MSKERKEEIDKLVKELEEGVTKIFETDFVKYLDFISKFHNYSFGNAILIMTQKPDASLCAGFRTWEKMGRHVNKGEKAIKIIAPMSVKKEVLQPVTDEKTGEIKTDSEGNPITEKKMVMAKAFQVANIFDVSQTSGAELPIPEINELTGDVDGYNNMIDAITNLLDVPVSYEKIKNGAKGYYSPSEKKIVINEGMSELQTLKTLVHESMHRFLHDKDGCLISEIEENKPTREQRETEAEAGAYVVLKHFDCDTSDYSFNYVCSWSNGKDMKVLKESLDTISKAADWMIDGIEEQLRLMAEEEQGIAMVM